MATFIIIALLVTVVTLGLLIWPLRKNRNSISYERQAQNIHYAKERIQELDEQLQNASISATDYEALKLEIENTLADDIDIAKQNANDDTVLNAPKSNQILVVLLCLILPLSALGFYSLVGTPESFSLAKQGSSQKTTPQAGKEQANNQEVTKMLETIEQRLKDHPDDVRGWNLLASTYIKLGRYDDSKRSLLNLMRIQGESAELLSTLADVSGLAASGNLDGEAKSFIDRALELDPNFPQALWLAGLASAQAEDTNSAIGYWNRLLPLLSNAPDQQVELRELIKKAQADLARKSGNDQPATEVAGSETSSTGIAAPIETTKKINEETKETIEGVRVAVSISSSMAAKAQPTDLVFVFAKATNGPPAPLAVKRLTVADLPTTINLKDSDAMLAQFKLSLFEDISISARVAKSGNPVAQNGDLQSNTVDTKNNTEKLIEVLISSEIN